MEFIPADESKGARRTTAACRGAISHIQIRQIREAHSDAVRSLHFLGAVSCVFCAWLVVPHHHEAAPRPSNQRTGTLSTRAISRRCRRYCAATGSPPDPRSKRSRRRSPRPSVRGSRLFVAVAPPHAGGIRRRTEGDECQLTTMPRCRLTETTRCQRRKIPINNLTTQPEQ